MIHLYDFDNTDYEKNGDYDISNIVIEDDYYSGNINEIPTYKISVTTEDNELWKKIVENKIIKIETPYGDDLFRIEETEVSSEDYILDIYTKQIFSDCSKILAKDTSNENIYICETGNVTGQGAMNKLFNGTQFKGHSNITSIYNTRWERKSITEALIGDADNSFINKYGGELFVKKFDITVNDKIGSDNGVEILYGKNIAGITKRVDFTGVITRIVPIGYNGLRLTGKTPYVDSPLINKYPFIREQVIEFSDVKVKENENEDGFATEEDARKELIRLSRLMFSEQHIDTPNVNIKIDMVDLSETDEYKNYKQLETVLKGDTVHCKHSKLNITTDARCLNFHYSAKSKKILSIEIGDVTESYFQNQIDLSNKLQKILDGDKVKADMMAGIINGLQTKFIAQYNIAEKQHVRAMLFSDDDINSPNFGAVCIGSMGIELASKKTADGRSWDWKTFITGGLVRADFLIGILTNADGSFKIDLSSNGGCEFYNEDKLAIRIKNNVMDFFASGNTNVNIGSLGSTRASKNGVWDPDGLPYIEMWHNPDDSVMAIGYKDKTDGTIPPYIRFDKSLKYNKSAPIAIDEAVCMGDYFNVNGWKFFLNKEKYPDLYLGTSTMGLMWCNGGFIASGDIECKGNKKCIQETKNFGDVSFYATEDMDSYLTYTSSIGEKYKCEETEYMSEYKSIIKIPQIVKETINTNLEYRVYINKLSFGDYKIKTYPSYFVVTSDKPLIFQYYIRGIRKGFENELLKNNMKKYEDKLKNRSKTLYTYRQSRKAANEWINNGECFEG